MRFIEFDYNKLNGPKVYKKSDNLALLEAFRKSGLKCGKVDGWMQKDAGSAASAINQTAGRYNIKSVRAISRRGEVYLLNEVLLNKED